MDELVRRFAPGGGRVLDVGSRDTRSRGGGHRGIFAAEWQYCGLDLVPGPGVNIVAEPYAYPFDDAVFDLVISGQTIEHVACLTRWARELARVCHPGGLVIVVGPWSWPIHGHPKSYPELCDYWRVLPDGLRRLFGPSRNGGTAGAGLDVIECATRDTEAYCVARKGDEA